MSEHAATTVQARPTIADILLSHGFVGEEELAAALEMSDRTGQPLGQVLVEAGAITRLELASALAEQWSDPDASITLLPRPLPQPPAARSAAGAELVSSTDAIYLGRLHDAVADLARRVGEAEPLLAEMERRAAGSLGPETLEALDARVSALAEHLEATLGRMTELEASLGTTADQVEELTDGVEQAFTSLQAGTGELAERLAVIASIAETAPTSGDLADLQRAVAELADRPRTDETLGDRIDAVSSELDAAVATFTTLSAAVGEVAARPEADPALAGRLEELEQRLQELSARAEADPALPGRFDQLVARVESQAVLYDAVAAELRASIETVAAAPGVDPETAGRMDELAGRIAELAGQVESLAAVAASGDDGVAIEELRGALEELGRRRAGDEETTARLDGLAATVDELVARSEADPAVAGRLDELAGAITALAGDPAVAELRSTIDALAARAHAGDATLADIGRRVEELAQRPLVDADAAARLQELTGVVAALRSDEALTLLRADVDEMRSRLETDDESLSELRAAAAELAARPAGDPELAARLASLGARLEALESAPPTAPAGLPAAGDAAWTEEAAKLAERLDALTARLDEAVPGAPTAGVAVAQAPPRAAAPTESGGETEQELERLRMAIERMSLHLGEQERAIAEVMRSRGVSQRLDELESRIDDVAAGVGGADGAPAADGTVAPGSANVEVRALVRRLDSAEAALEAERDKLLTKLERIASSLDWRMRRLEAGDDPNA